MLRGPDQHAPTTNIVMIFEYSSQNGHATILTLRSTVHRQQPHSQQDKNSQCPKSKLSAARGHAASG